MVYGYQLIAKGRSDERLVRYKLGGPSGVVRGYLAGQCHFRFLAAVPRAPNFPSEDMHSLASDQELSGMYPTGRDDAITHAPPPTLI